MKLEQAHRWLWVLALVGCNAKLQVDPGAGGAGNGVSGSATGGDRASGGGGAGGALAGGPLPGERGQKCIPGATTTEGDGSPAQTLVVTLDRCNEGLECDATNHCSSIPDCPQESGACVVYGSEPEMGGSGGSAGNVGAGGMSGASSGPITQAEAGITSLSADDTHLYWLEYGTRDKLGNYQHDGALNRYDLATGKSTTLSDNLPGPITLGITSEHAYVGVDGGGLIGAPAHFQLLRVSLSAGTTEVIQVSALPDGFAASRDQAYWSTTNGIYTVATSGADSPMQVRDSYAENLEADDTDLYFIGQNVILRQALTATSAAGEQVVSVPHVFGLGGDSVWGIETLGAAGGMILDQVPKTGGEWTRKRGLGADGGPELVQVIDDRFFVTAHPREDHPRYDSNPASGFDLDYSKNVLLTGSLSSSAPPVRLLEISKPVAWQLTAKTVFWTDGHAIFSRAVPSN